MFIAGDENRELMRKEITELKRAINEEVLEKEAVQKTAAELRGTIKKSEGDKIELSRLVGDAKQRIGGQNNSHIFLSQGCFHSYFTNVMKFHEKLTLGNILGIFVCFGKTLHFHPTFRNCIMNDSIIYAF